MKWAALLCLLYLVEALPLQLARHHEQDLTINDACQEPEGTHLPSDESCTGYLPPNWIFCPSRSRGKQVCSYFCPSADITVQTRPKDQHDCVASSRYMNKWAPGGRTERQKASPGWIPDLAIGDTVDPDHAILNMLKESWKEFAKTDKDPAVHELFLWLTGLNKAEARSTDGYQLLMEVARQHAIDFMHSAFGLSKEYLKGQLKGFGDVIRLGDISGDQTGLDIQSVHADADVVVQNDGNRFMLFEKQDIDGGGHMKSIELNIWMPLENQQMQPFVIFDDVMLRTHACVKPKVQRAWGEKKEGVQEDKVDPEDGTVHKLGLTEEGMKIAKEWPLHYSSAWNIAAGRSVRFGAVQMFHGKLLDGDLRRLSVDVRFTVPYADVESRLPKDEHYLKYLRNLREYGAIPLFADRLSHNCPEEVDEVADIDVDFGGLFSE